MLTKRIERRDDEIIKLRGEVIRLRDLFEKMGVELAGDEIEDGAGQEVEIDLERDLDEVERLFMAKETKIFGGNAAAKQRKDKKQLISNELSKNFQIAMGKFSQFLSPGYGKGKICKSPELLHIVKSQHSPGTNRGDAGCVHSVVRTQMQRLMCIEYISLFCSACIRAGGHQ